MCPSGYQQLFLLDSAFLYLRPCYKLETLLQVGCILLVDAFDGRGGDGLEQSVVQNEIKMV